MPTLQQARTALRNAEAAGDEESAELIRQAIAEAEASTDPYDQRVARRAEEIRQRAGNISVPVSAPEETGIFADFTGGFGRGFVGVGESASLGLAALAEEETETELRNKIKSAFDFEFGGDPESFASGLGSAFGSIAGIAVPAALTGAAVAAAPIAAPAAAIATGAAGLLGVSAAAGEASERAREAGATEEERSAAALRGAPIGLLEVLPIARFVRRVDIPVLSKLVDKLGPKTVQDFGDLARNVTLTGGLEAGQEAASEFLQNLNEQQYNEVAELFAGTAEGATFGGIAGGVLELFLGRRARGVDGTDATDDTPTAPAPVIPVTPVTETDVDDEAKAAAEEVTRLDADADTEETTRTAETVRAELQQGLPVDADGVLDTDSLTQEQIDTLVQRSRELSLEDRKLLGIADEVTEGVTEEVTEEVTEGVTEEVTEGVTDNQVAAELKAQAEREEAERQRLVADAEKEETKQQFTQLNTAMAAQQREAEKAKQTKELEEEAAKLSDNQQQVLLLQEELREAKARPAPVYNEVLDTLKLEDPENTKTTFSQKREEAKAIHSEAKEKYDNDIAQVEERLANAEATVRADLDAATTPIREAEASLIEGRGTEAELEAVEGFNRAYEEVYGPATDNAKRQFTDVAAKIKEPPLPKSDQQTIQQFLAQYDALPGKNKKGDTKAVADYLKLGEATGNPANAVTFAARDSATTIEDDASALRTERDDLPEMPQGEAELMAGTGRVKAEKFLAWADANLSTAAKTRIQEIKGDVRDAEGRSRRAKNLAAQMERTKKIRAAQKKRKGERTKEDNELINEANLATAPAAKIGTIKTGVKYDARAAESLDARGREAKALKAKRDAGQELTPAEQDIITEADARAKDKEMEYLRQQEANRMDMARLPKNAALSTTLPMPDAATTALRNGDLKGALEAIAVDVPNPAVKRFAKRLAENVGTTKVVLVDNLKGDRGDSAYGLFDPKTNTISLDASEGLSVHALVHEMGHAGVSATVADPKNPLTVQLQEVFDGVKDKLSSHYGSQDLQEFTSEYMSNPEFRSELALLSTPKADSVLGRVAEIIGNMLRKLLRVPPKKPNEDRLTPIDDLVDIIIAPAPEFRDAGQLAMASKNGNVAKLVDPLAREVVRESREITKADFNEAVDEISRITDRGSKGAIGMGLGFLNNSAFNDLADYIDIPAIKNFTRSIETSNGAIDATNKTLNATTASIERKLKAALKNNPDAINIFNRLTTDSTMDGVDPSKPESNYKTPKKKAAWKRLNAEYQKLGPDGQAAYVQLRDTYVGILDDLKASLESRINSVVKDKDKAKSLYTSITARLLDKNRIEPYFPLAREGDYWLKWFVTPTNPDGTKGPMEEVVEAYTSPRARDRAKASLLAIARGEADPVDVDGTTFAVSGISPFNGNRNMKFSGGVAPTAFTTQMVNTLSNAGVKPEVIDSVVQEFITALPESSFLKAFKRRENKLGAMDDAVRALKTKGYGMARRAANMKSAEDIRGSLEQVFEQLKASTNPKITANLREAIETELEDRKELTINPPDDFFNNAAKELNRIAFFGTMGFNAASTIANSFQIPAVVMPFLYGKTDFRTASRAMDAARRLFTGSFIEHQVVPYGDSDIVANEKNKLNTYTPSVDNYYLLTREGELQLRDDLPDLDTPNYYQGQTKRQFLEELRPVIQEADNRGFLTRSLWADQMGADMAGQAKGSFLRRGYENLTKWSALPFHTVERANRQMTVVASYLNEMARLNTKPNKAKGEDTLSDADKKTLAMQVAMQETSQLNGGSALNTAPRFAQSGPLGRLAMMFKTYGFTMYYNQFKMMSSALKQAREYGLSDEQGRIAMKQFVASNGTIAAIAGIQGVPLVGILQGVADLFLLDDDEEDADLLTRKYFGDPLYRGGIQYLTNFAGAEVDIAARIGLSNLILGSNRYDFNKSFEEEVFTYFGGPSYGYGSSIARGMNDIIFKGETQRGVEAILPSAFRNMLQAERFDREGAKTRRGDPIVDDFNTGEIAVKFFGFAPASYTNAQELNQDVKKIDRAVSSQKTKLLRRYYTAIRAGDDVSEIVDEIIEHNRKHANKGKTAVIVPDTIIRSMKQHAKTSLTMHNGVTLSPTMSAYARDIQEELEYQPWYMNN